MHMMPTVTLTIRSKLIALMICFLLPILLLFALFVLQSEKDIAFSAAERDGVRYLDAVRPLHQQLGLGAVTGKVQGADKGMIAALRAVGSSLNEAMSAADQFKAFDAVVATPTDAVKPADLAAGAALVTQVGNGSNLILDPDLDSFYAMDIVVVKLPDVIAKLGDLAVAVRAAESDNKLSDDEQLGLAVLSGQIKDVIDNTNASLAQIYAGNADHSVEPVLAPVAARFNQACSLYLPALNKAIVSLRSSGQSGPEVSAAAQALLGASSEFWSKTSGELDRLLAARLQGFHTKLWSAVAVSSLAVLLAIGFGLSVVRSIMRGVSGLIASVEGLGTGALDAVVPFTEQRTEIGAIAKAISGLRSTTVARVNAANIGEQRRKDREREQMTGIILRFRQSISAVIAAVNGSTAEIRGTATTLSQVAELTSGEAQSASAATTQASASIQTIASASEELGASIDGIAEKAESASAIVDKATAVADETNRKMSHLARSAEEIGAVVAIIKAIADQTNLLALNATIEAARAGEAGRGFAVVATEVKSLAAQTARATDDITHKILGVQSASGEVAQAISTITATMSKVNEVTAAIAAAVAQQSQATREITLNVTQAADGSAEVARGVDGVAGAVVETNRAASGVEAASNNLAATARQLSETVESFLKEISGEIEDRRSADRHPADAEVGVTVEGKMARSRLYDISTTGMRIDNKGLIKAGQVLELTLPSGSTIQAHVVWTNASEAGLRFQGATLSQSDIEQATAKALGRAA